MHLILTGATGLVGSGVLDAMIKMKDVTKISVISRRPVPMAEDAKDPKINVIIHKDFEKYDADLLSQLKGASGCVWALGISQTKVGKEEYVKITKDYALAAAKAFQSLPGDDASNKDEPFRFVYVSGAGSTLKPGLFTSLFARVKGETELSLSEMRAANPLFGATSVRPAFIDYHAHAAIKPYIPAQGAMMDTLASVLGPAIRVGYKSMWSPTAQLGQFLTEMAMGRFDDRLQGEGVERLGEFAILENSAFRRLAGLDNNGRV